jgi:hypothetical protein
MSEEQLYNKIISKMNGELNNRFRSLYDFSTPDTPGDLRGSERIGKPNRNIDGIPYHIAGMTFMDEINVVAP